MEPIVSVVIPNYNNSKYVIDSISSVLSQTYTHTEIIVIDDGSTDDSLTKIKSFGGRIRLIEQEHQGAASARNRGIRSATGEFIAFLDSDDTWKKSKLELQVKKMTTGNYGLVYCSLQEFSSSETSGLIHKARYEGDCYTYIKKFPYKAIIIGGCSTALIQTSLLANSIFFDEEFKGVGEDLDFFRKVSRIACVGVLPEILVNYRRHQTNLTTVSKREYFEGNSKAVVNLINEDLSIGRLEGRIIWIKLLTNYLKTFAKVRDFTMIVRIGVMMFTKISQYTRFKTFSGA